MRRFFGTLTALLVATLLLASCSDQPEPPSESELGTVSSGEQRHRQRFGSEPVWHGLAAGHCGSTVVVVSTDGELIEYSPPKQFFTQLKSHEVNQGESPRPAADLVSLMNRYGADRLRFISCSGDDMSLDKAMLAEKPGLLVLTGKGLLKLAGQQGEDYVTAIRQIKEIRFSMQEKAVQVVADEAEADGRNEQ